MTPDSTPGGAATAGALAEPAGAPPTNQPASHGPRLGFAIKTFYGLGSVAFGVETVALGSLLLLFFNQVVGLPAPWVGAAIMIALVFDAIFDPIIGQWSDHVRSRLGRRHPFMYASALPLAIAFYFLWNPPHGWNNSPMFAYLITLLVSVRLLVSLYEIPSSALAPELTLDYDERTSLLSYRFFFGMIGGTAMAMLAFQVFLRKDATHTLGVLDRNGYERWGLVASIVMFTTILVSCAGTQGRGLTLKSPPPTGASWSAKAREIKNTLANRSFLALMIAGIISAIAGGLSSGLGLYITTYFWELSSKQISYLVGFGFVSALLGVSLAPTVSKWMGKKRAMISLFAISLAASVIPIPLRLVGLMPPNHSFALLAALVVDGIVRDTLGIMGFIIVSSMMADVVEDIAVHTGQRSEGLLFAANGLLQKCVSGVGTFVSGLLLAFVRFPQGAVQGHVDPMILRHLVLIYVPITAACSAIAIAVLGFYRIDRASHQRNLDQLRDAAAIAETSQAEALEGITPLTRAI
ncbi:MAG TPA: MFS transporter [Candidatus Binataceae bacterium]|nr:MFS transporter [Candidatus Binataceae bacterium]